MKQILNRRIVTLTRWVCVCVIIGTLSGQLAATVAAQEPTPLPTPTPAPTWTPTVVPTNTPDPAATPTVDPTAAARVVDFRADSTDIDLGDCVMFSWVVRGDIDRVEFDQIGDEKVPLLVSDMDSRQECPTEDTTYELRVTWLDATKTKDGIEIEVAGGDGGSSGSGGATATPAGTAVYVPVTPIPVIGTPASTIVGSGGVVVTPVGVLGSVRILPETGHVSPPMAQVTKSESDPATTGPEPGFRSAFAGWLAAISLAIVFTALIVGSKVIGDSEASQ